MSQSKFCPRCTTEKAISEFYVNKARSDGLSGYCVPCQRLSEEERRARKRTEVLTHLGGRCARCGFDDARALCIDHVGGGGTEERKSLWAASAAFYRAVLTDTEGRFQLLCWNCNHIKRIEESEHKGNRVYVRTEPTERRVTDRQLAWTPERRAAQSVARKGKPLNLTAEQRQQRSEAAKRREAAKRPAPPSPATT